MGFFVWLGFGFSFGWGFWVLWGFCVRFFGVFRVFCLIGLCCFFVGFSLGFFCLGGLVWGFFLVVVLSIFGVFLGGCVCVSLI